MIHLEGSAVHWNFLGITNPVKKITQNKQLIGICCLIIQKAKKALDNFGGVMTEVEVGDKECLHTGRGA